MRVVLSCPCTRIITLGTTGVCAECGRLDGVSTMGEAFPRLANLGVLVIRGGDGTCYVDRTDLLEALERKMPGSAARFEIMTKGNMTAPGDMPFAWDCEKVVEQLLHQAE